MIHPAADLLLTLALVAASPATAQQARKPAAAQVTAAAPVPRTTFIQTMDNEFGSMDADKDKIVTKAEIEQFQRAVNLLQAREKARALFGKMDADKNGQLSITEFERMATTPPPPNAAPVLGQADLNKDGKITLVEYRTAKLAKFDRMDADKDGVVSVAEMKAAGLVR